MRDKIIFYLNGTKRSISTEDVDPGMPLSEYLRGKEGLTGTKVACDEGACSSCLVVVMREDTTEEAVNGCLFAMAQADGTSITTIEGLKDHAIPKKLAELHGVQCGYCSPGMTVQLYAGVQSGVKDLDKVVDNLCRCTGYRPIMDAARSIGGCVVDVEDLGDVSSCSKSKVSEPVPKTEVAFPDDLCGVSGENLVLKGSKTTWIRPASLDALVEACTAYPTATILAGGTGDVLFQGKRKGMIIALSGVSDLAKIEESSTALNVGARVTLNQLEKQFESGTSGVAGAFRDAIRFCATRAVRNAATLVGNILGANSDFLPLLIAVDATASLADGTVVPIADAVAMVSAARKIIVGISIPLVPDSIVEVFKQSSRRTCARSAAALAATMTVVDQTITASKIVVAGGSSIPPIVLDTSSLQGLSLPGLEVSKAVKAISLPATTIQEETKEPQQDEDGQQEHDSSPTYRSTLWASFLHKVLTKAKGDEKQDLSENKDRKLIATGAQTWSSHQDEPLYPAVTLNAASKRSPVGDAVPHESALASATGHAKYTVDLHAKDSDDCMHAALVLSTVAHGEIVKINKVEGAYEYFGAEDIPGANVVGLVGDEECFRASTVTSVGQPVAMVVAETPELAQNAAKGITVEYKKLPSLLTIEDAIKNDSYYLPPHGRHCDIVCGLSFDDAVKEAKDPVVVQGEQYIGGQEHWYLEVNAAVATPMEDGGMRVVSSTQNPAKTQQTVACLLGVPSNKVVASVLRVGGGFGGKEMKAAAVAGYAAVGAAKMQRPVKIVLDRATDIAFSGQRHPCLVRYKAAAKDGKILALKVDLYFLAGYSLDLSMSVCQQALFKTCNAYAIPNVESRGFVCKTHTTSNTAFRAFGGPQAMMACETIVDHVATALNIDPHVLRKENLLPVGATTFYGQTLDNFVNMPRLWSKCEDASKYETRAAAVRAFNESHEWRKRGIAMLPVQFGLSFVNRFLETGGALVHCYVDGSVLVSHGGVEIGQGLNTKIKQAVARVFGLPLSAVRIDETSTDKASVNSPPTAASMAQELFATAAVDAASQIATRLIPLQKNLPADASFADLCQAAYFQRMNLSAFGFYKTKTTADCYDWAKILKPGETNKARGDPYNYFCCGVGCTEVELDVLTGDVRALRADIVMDLGAVINPGLDIGQIEGAYLQGLGMYMLEEFKVDPTDGSILSTSAAKYKIPTADDMPTDFRVVLIDKDGDEPSFPIHSSRAVGEPPYFLGATAYFATRDAIKSARAHDAYFRTDTPLTPEYARMACTDIYAS